MTTAQNKAVQSHRERLKRRGLVRLEVQAPKADAALIREVARALRGDQKKAAKVRTRLRDLVGRGRKPGLKALLASAPLEGIELSRSRDLGRDVDL